MCQQKEALDCEPVSLLSALLAAFLSSVSYVLTSRLVFASFAFSRTFFLSAAQGPSHESLFC